MNKFFVLVLSIFYSTIYGQNKPKDFVYLSEINSSIIMELRYISEENFIGKPIDGYLKPKIIVTKPTAIALNKIQLELKKIGLGLKIFDAYRPQQAVDHFVRWAKVLNDTLMKAKYYPNVPKSQLFKLGYIASKSGHSRGSTVDLTIINLETKQELDMGSSYDFFGDISHPFNKRITKDQQKNRMLLREVMLKNDFIPYENEWWHFTLKNEPFPKKYFNFPIE